MSSLIRLYTAGLIFAAVLLSGCATPLPRGEVVHFQSADYVFLSELLQGEPGAERSLDGWLMLPDPGVAAPPYPVVVMTHSSWGRGKQEWGYSQELLEKGIAVFAIDSFTPRGVDKTSADQSLVSESSMLQDVYSALNRLSSDPLFDRDRIGVLGFSKGGIVALYSALERINNVMARDGNRFAVHVAHYPWCGIQMVNPVTTGAPILVQAGEEDSITPLALCRELAEEWRTADAGADIEVIGYQDARHGFDHPMLEKLTWVPMGAQVPGDCHIREIPGNRFMEDWTDQEITSENFYRILRQCGGMNGVAGGNPEAGKAAMQNMLQRVTTALLETKD